MNRAAVVLPTDSPDRVELLTEFAEASIEQGQFDAARKAIEEAADSASKLDDPRLEARARLMGYLLGLASTGSAGELDATVRGLQSMIEVFEQSDDLGWVARAWHLLGTVEGTAGRYDRTSEAGQQTVRYGREANDARSIARGVLNDSYAALHGTTPVPEGIRRCEDYLQLVHGNRTAEAVVLAALGQFTAMAGQFDEARALAARSRQMVADLGPSGLAASLSDHISRIEFLAGDAEAAERELRRDYDVLAAMNEAYFRSTIGALLGHALWRLGRGDEAVEFARISRELADIDDVYSQVLWRTVEAKYLAGQGRGDEGVALVEEALRLLEASVDIELKADTLFDLAEVLAIAGRRHEGGPHLREALALYREKGDLVLSAATEQQLATLEGVTAG